MKKIVSIAIASLLSFGAQAATGKCADIEKAAAEFAGVQKGGYSTLNLRVWNIEGSDSSCYVNFNARVDEVKLAAYDAEVYGTDRLQALNTIASNQYRQAQIKRLTAFIDTFPQVAKANGVTFAVVNYYVDFTQGFAGGYAVNKVFRNGKMGDY